MPTPAPRLVIFDCDGVLIDSEIIAARPVQRAGRTRHRHHAAGSGAALAGIPDADMWQTLQEENARPA
ncbi:HAD family hydrolase [Achromobacter xylosoxidans]